MRIIQPAKLKAGETRVYKRASKIKNAKQIATTNETCTLQRALNNAINWMLLLNIELQMRSTKKNENAQNDTFDLKMLSRNFTSWIQSKSPAFLLWENNGSLVLALTVSIKL